MKVTIAQMNPTVGDIKGNMKKMEDVLSKTSSDLIIFPELYITGYPPRDLLERREFIKKVQKANHEVTLLSKKYPERGILFGTVLPNKNEYGKGLYNSAVLVYNGKILIEEHKSLLPTYDVFDEARYFDPSSEISTVSFKNEILGISICEDAWNDPDLWLKRNYRIDPIEILVKKGATLLINISASPFSMGKDEIRYRIIRNHALKHKKRFIFVNQVGGNDELIFDGKSMYIDENGNLIDILPSFEEFIKTIDLGLKNPVPFTPEERISSVYRALVLGLRDYMRKCGFKKAVLGLSGGIDSAVTCCIAVEAMGSENVLGVSMPSEYSSEGSVKDSKKLAENLGIEFKIIPITPIFRSYLSTLKEHFEGRKEDVTEENIQARIRGNILMALSNKFGYLVLSTGNKSELAVGYCTLYGDMSGGLAVISDVPKTMVYELAYYINRESEIIPEEIIKKPPSAELRPDQLDQDTLPPYDILDRILHLYLDQYCTYEEIVKEGLDPETVRWVINAVNRNEYKRRQAVPGLKVTTKAFGTGRRMPIAAVYE
ncbi:MAG: NAD+ synthase [Methanomicrobia archaeon]|nr:NAD+ synthase [Methanomicrobia archaeon]